MIDPEGCAGQTAKKVDSECSPDVSQSVIQSFSLSVIQSSGHSVCRGAQNYTRLRREQLACNSCSLYIILIFLNTKLAGSIVNSRIMAAVAGQCCSSRAVVSSTRLACSTMESRIALLQQQLSSTLQCPRIALYYQKNLSRCYSSNYPRLHNAPSQPGIKKHSAPLEQLALPQQPVSSSSQWSQPAWYYKKNARLQQQLFSTS